MHQAALARRNPAGWTRDGGELFRRQVVHPHQGKIPKNKPKYCSKWHSSKLRLKNGRSWRLTADSTGANAGKTMNSRQLVDDAVEDGGDLAHFVGEDREFFRKDRLHAVGEGFVRLVVDFDEEAIGANGDGSAGEREYFVALAGTVAGIDEDGQVAALLDGGDDGEVERVARKVGKGADAALAKHDVVVALRHDVFGGHEKFVERGGHAALEEDVLFGAAGALEQREILHVARADLNDVGVFLDKVEGFGDDAEAVRGADLGENL